MSTKYKRISIDSIPKAKVCFNPFHIMQIVQTAVDGPPKDPKIRMKQMILMWWSNTFPDNTNQKSRAFFQESPAKAFCVPLKWCNKCSYREPKQ